MGTHNDDRSVTRSGFDGPYWEHRRRRQSEALEAQKPSTRDEATGHTALEGEN